MSAKLQHQFEVNSWNLIFVLKKTKVGVKTERVK